MTEAARLEEEIPVLQEVAAEHQQQLNAAADAFLAGIIDRGVVIGVLIFTFLFTSLFPA